MKIEESECLYEDFFRDPSVHNHPLAFQADIGRPELENDVWLPGAHVVDAADRRVVEVPLPVSQRVEHEALNDVLDNLKCHGVFRRTGNVGFPVSGMYEDALAPFRVAGTEPIVHVSSANQQYKEVVLVQGQLLSKSSASAEDGVPIYWTCGVPIYVYRPRCPFKFERPRDSDKNFENGIEDGSLKFF